MKDDILSLVLFKLMLIIISDDFKDINKGLKPIILFMVFFFFFFLNFFNFFL
jgi:hypothetical protein